MAAISRFVFLAAILGSLCSCHFSSNDAEPGLTQLADRIARNSSSLTSPFSVAAEVVNPHSTAPALRFRLTNISLQQQVVEEGTLPWQNASFDSVVGVTVYGKVLLIRPSFGRGIRSDHPAQIVVASGATLVGELLLNNLYPVDRNPRDQDVLLLWAYQQRRYSYAGIALLPKQ